MKKLLVTMITSLCFIGAFSIYEKSNIYIRQAVVDNINGNIVTFCDNCGYMWQWHDDENLYTVGKKVILYMDDMNTGTIYDDVIITIKQGLTQSLFYCHT